MMIITCNVFEIRIYLKFYDNFFYVKDFIIFSLHFNFLFSISGSLYTTAPPNIEFLEQIISDGDED